MSAGFEFNKLSAAVLVAGIIAMSTGYVTNALYKPELEVEKRGFEIEVAEEAGNGMDVAAGNTGPVNIAEYMAAGDAAKGEKLTKKCTACHSFDKGGKNKIGPNLYGILGRDVASVADFAYSDALKGLGGKWGYQELSEFIKKPKKYAPGTKMVFAGLKKPEDRANLIAYLRSLSDSPLPLPAAPEKSASAAATMEVAENN